MFIDNVTFPEGVYSMPELTEKPEKMTIPVLIRRGFGNDEKHFLSIQTGYGFMYKGVPIFLQKAGATYIYNIYGISLGVPGMNLYTDHRKSASDIEALEKILQLVFYENYRDGGRVKTTNIQEMREIFDFVNNNPGVSNRKYLAHMKAYYKSLGRQEKTA